MLAMNSVDVVIPWLKEMLLIDDEEEGGDDDNDDDDDDIGDDGSACPGSRL
jgi:hypothetical protein